MLTTQSYDNLSRFYRQNNIAWNDLAEHQQFVLIRSYRRKFIFANDAIDDRIIIKNIITDLNIDNIDSDLDSDYIAFNIYMRDKFAM